MSVTEDMRCQWQTYTSSSPLCIFSKKLFFDLVLKRVDIVSGYKSDARLFRIFWPLVRKTFLACVTFTTRDV